MKSDIALLTVKLELRKLYDRFPTEFRQIVEELFWSAFEMDRVLPPIRFVRGKPVHVTDFPLAMLLSDYRNARARGVGREVFISRLAAAGYRFDNGYTVITWTTESTVTKQLKAAEKRAKHDEGFASLVDWCRPLRGAAKLLREGEKLIQEGKITLPSEE